MSETDGVGRVARMFRWAWDLPLRKLGESMLFAVVGAGKKVEMFRSVCEDE